MPQKYTEFEHLSNGNLRVTLLPNAQEDVQDIAPISNLMLMLSSPRSSSGSSAMGGSSLLPKPLAHLRQHPFYPKRLSVTSMVM